MAELGLHSGTPIIIERIGQTRYVEEKFLGRIESADAAQLHITIPSSFVQLLPLAVGETIQLKASLPEGMYRFSGRILSVGPGFFTMPYPFNTSRLQRREQRRILVDGIVVFAVHEASGRPNFATLVDISIGGLQLQAEKWLPPGAQLHIEFGLQAGLRGAAVGIIRWKKEARSADPNTRAFCYGLKFTEIDEQLRWQIASFIRDHERNLLSNVAEAVGPASEP